MSSLVILSKTAALVAAREGRIENVDATLIAEAPKIGPHIEEMRARIGEALGIPPRRVGLKATTNERIGFIGRGEGMAAMAVAGVEFNDAII